MEVNPGIPPVEEFISSLPEIGFGVRSKTVDLNPAIAQQLLIHKGIIARSSAT
jgi:hypothetical protein